jgi:hypothetical protein
MARLAPLAFLLAALLSVLAIGTPTAHADGKVFLSIASDPSGSASATMPRQRAIIAFKDGEQRLAIDTAFVGPGEEFAWLVPLPSEPEILPATKGMFDTAAMITGPRVSNQGPPFELTIAGLLILLSITIALLATTKRLVALIGVLLMIAVVFVVLPSLAGSRSSAPNQSVEIVNQQEVGLFDTVVLRGNTAADVMAWLDANEFVVPTGAGSVMQSYLDRGWVFAAARLRDDNWVEGERRAHPLQFRFQTESPVYPMALTAVGNESIELELFVFAGGAASAPNLRKWNALATQQDDRDAHSRRGAPVLRGRPGTIAHPALVDIAMDLPMLTRLSGRLSPERQREDISLAIGEAAPENPLLRTPSARWSIVLASAVWTSVGVGLLALLFIGIAFNIPRIKLRSDDAPRWPWPVVTVFAGLFVGVWVYFNTPAYAGEATRGIRVMMLERELEQAAMAIEAEAIDQSAATIAELETIRSSVFENLDIDPPTGDSPLHYRIEFSEDETEAQFIWHDLIGAEHRVVIPLAPEDASEPSGP